MWYTVCVYEAVNRHKTTEVCEREINYYKSKEKTMKYATNAAAGVREG